MIQILLHSVIFVMVKCKSETCVSCHIGLCSLEYLVFGRLLYGMSEGYALQCLRI